MLDEGFFDFVVEDLAEAMVAVDFVEKNLCAFGVIVDFVVEDLSEFVVVLGLVNLPLDALVATDPDLHLSWVLGDVDCSTVLSSNPAVLMQGCTWLAPSVIGRNCLWAHPSMGMACFVVDTNLGRGSPSFRLVVWRVEGPVKNLRLQ